MADATRKRKQRLGRGLSSLMQSPVKVNTDQNTNAQERAPAPSPATAGTATQPPPASPAPSTEVVTEPSGRRIIEVPVGSVRVSRFQPRTVMDQHALEQLAASIRSAGVMQPVLVIPCPDTEDAGPEGRTYELVAGERRWRAAQLAGLDAIPAIVTTLSDQEAAEWAVIENIQREDLGPLERAKAFEMLVQKFGLTHGQVGERVGLDRSTITNFIRLTELEPELQQMLEAGTLTTGHCKALLKLSSSGTRLNLAERVAAGGWSVRKTEQAVGVSESGGTPTQPGSKAPSALNDRSASLVELERQISEHLGTKVRLKTDKTFKRGKIVIDFFDLDQFDGLMERVGFVMRG